MTWLINDATFESLNLRDVRLSVVTQSPDYLLMQQVSAYDSDPAFAYGDEVILTRSGDQFFKGTCTAISRRGTGRNERINYQISGPWWQLSKVIYQQQFTRYVSGVESVINLARLIVGTDADGSRLDSGGVITQVVNYAISQLGAAAQFSLGTVDVSTQMPYEELNALSCAEVITRCLRWNPDVVAYFDYTEATPVLHFVKRSNLSERSYAHSDVVITDASINPRDDLQYDGVVVQYEREDTIGDDTQTVIIEDSAGTTTDPLKTLYLFFDLEGANVSYINQKVVSETIDTGSGTWWQKHEPKLANATINSVTNHAKTALDDGGENDGTSYSKALISGSIADWMQGVGVCQQTAKATIDYTLEGETITEVFHLQVTGTNANSSTYSTVGSETVAEPTPVGLAASILASFSALQYEGELSLKALDIPSDPLINKRLNLVGGRTAWETMAAQIFNVDYDLNQGATRIRFGPARHLGATDLFQLARNVRTRKGSSGVLRATIGGSKNDLPTRSANTVSAGGGSGGATVGINVRKIDDTSVKVTEGSVEGATLSETTLSVSDGSEIWVKATLPSEGSAPNAVVAVVGDPGADTETQTSRLWATITIADDVLSISPHRSGSPDLDSCGSNHAWIF
jgi:hypothetical protein